LAATSISATTPAAAVVVTHLGKLGQSKEKRSVRNTPLCWPHKSFSPATVVQVPLFQSVQTERIGVAVRITLFLEEKQMSVNNQKSNEESLSNKTNAELEAEERELALEEKRLDLVIKRHTAAKIQAEEQATLDRVRTAAQAINQFLANRRATQANCSHKKGGTGAEAVIRGQGTSAMYCVIKHKLPVGKYFVLCTRCGKEWHPELTALQNGGVPRKATKGYYDALQYSTNNSESGSSRFDFQAVTAPIGESEEE
jgi:hypothetical protein